MRRSSFFVLLIALADFAGCASPRTDFYTLDPMSRPAATGADTSVSVGPVSVPAEVDRPQMVLRVAPNQVAVDEFHRWASPLPDAIGRVVAGNLAAILGTPRVAVSSQRTAAGAGYRVLIDVLRFESSLGGTAALDAVWTVRSTKDGTARTGRTVLEEAVPEKDYAALAAAHSRALERLSLDLSEAIRAMESGR